MLLLLLVQFLSGGGATAGGDCGRCLSLSPTCRGGSQGEEASAIRLSQPGVEKERGGGGRGGGGWKGVRKRKKGEERGRELRDNGGLLAPLPANWDKFFELSAAHWHTDPAWLL